MNLLHPQAKALLDQLAARGDSGLPTLEEERAQYEQVPGLSGSPEPIHALRDRTIPADDHDIPVRIYTPSADAALPVLIYAHGGSFVGGSLDSHDPALRSLANRSGCLIVAVDYRRAPEFPFPHGLHDVYGVVAWAARHAGEIGGDPRRLAIGGDSAGGNLAAATTLLARERGLDTLRLQLLLYPNTDLTLRHASWHTYDGVILTRQGMAVNVARYLADRAQPADPLVSPLAAGDLRRLPPAVIAVGTHDPLIDEIRAYATRLAQADVPVTLLTYPGLIHGFFQMAGVLDDSRRLIDEAAAALRHGL
jgi:acetyl esterase